MFLRFPEKLCVLAKLSSSACLQVNAKSIVSKQRFSGEHKDSVSKMQKVLQTNVKFLRETQKYLGNTLLTAFMCKAV